MTLTRRFVLGALTLCLSLPLACASEDGDTGAAEASTTGGDGDGDGDGDGGQEITLDFEARINGAPFACGNAQGLGNAASDVDITDLRMFISDVQLTSGDGETVDAPIVSDDTWAQARVALLDFESSCGDAGSAGTNASFTVSVPEGTYTGVSFNLGLPFDLNHSDASSPDSAAPLNTAALFWSWQGGYKFFRLDMKVGADATPWNVHLGSTMCMSDSPVTAPESACGRPNLPRISLDYDVGASPIVVDVGTLLGGTDLTSDADMTPPGCLSMPPDVAECTELFSRLGLDFETGACADDCAGQTVFTAG